MCTVNICIIVVCYVLCSVCEEDIVMLKSKGNYMVGKRMHTIFENKPYAAFWKIPYAEPPVNELKFKKDDLNPEDLKIIDITENLKYLQPPKKHEGWIDDITYDYSKPYNATCSNDLLEDCLYLSIYMPLVDKLQNNFSVLVWIHEHSNFHEPDFFIDEKILVITVSYRTSILGFLNTGDEFAKGNMGAKDVLMALRWVKENIAVFNGDVNKVTIAGSGNSATIVASCLVATVAKDLFNRAIIQSNSALSPADYSKYSFEVLNKLHWKLNGSFDFSRDKLYKMLNNAEVKTLTRISHNLFDSTEVRDRQRLINSFGPTVEANHDKAFMNEHPLEVYKRRAANNVDVMIGYTSLESIFKLKGFVKNKKLLKYLNYNFQYLLPFEGRSDAFGSVRYEAIKSKILDFYFKNGTIIEKSLKRYAKYVSDQVIYPAVRQARLHSLTTSNSVYLYRFSFKGLLNIGWDSVDVNYSEATAGDEICYLFRCKSVNDIYRSAEASNERQFIKRIARLWTNFAKCGNPTPKTKDDLLEDLKWKSLLDAKLNGLSIGQNIKMKNLPEEKRMKFWNDLKKEFFDVEKNKAVIRDEL